MVGCWVGCVGPLSSCFDEAVGLLRLVALVEGMFYPWGCNLVGGWYDGGNSESDVETWWAEALLYGLNVMNDWRWVSELVRSSEMVEVHVC